MSARRILIVGAGASGIAAAARLYENGLTNFQILEATDRIGGRINTIPFGVNMIDLGAQWCHGEKNNAVHELAGPLGLLESSIVSSGNVLVKSTGETVPNEITERLMAVAEGIMEAEDMSSYDGTLGDYFTERFMKIVTDAKMKDINRELIQQFLRFYENYQQGYIAIDSWYNLSASSLAAYEDCEGDQALSWMGKGYKSVLDLLMKKHPAQSSEPIPIEDKTLFNKTVSNINWAKVPDSPVTVRCTDGSSYDANHVIITTSVGVLKENFTTLFNPELPMIKQNAIRGIHLGTVNKIIMEFEKPFWTDKGNTFGLLWDAEELENIQVSNYAWTEGASAFFKIDRQPNLLAAWMIGKEGRQTELLSDREVIEGMMFLLKKFFKNEHIEEPVKIVRSKWSTDRNFRGSYSSHSLATDQLNTSSDDLAVPLTDCLGIPVLLFAGEATNQKQYGTVHGAIGSGNREADRLIKLYKK
ncbi:spermine oxidase-like [Ochlerotatus camptorhynchus]|uniref:spermine oxidase-like n=1 Tax=Ochlerotatus camptorhynchus TaxID=644619 RepID=UPI0031DD04CE